MYRVEYSPQAIKQLRKLDPFVMRTIYAWISKNLEGCTNLMVYFISDSYSFICRTASVVRIFFSIALSGRFFSTSV